LLKSPSSKFSDKNQLAAENDILEGKRVLIFQQRGWSLKIGHYIAQSLQDNGAILAALTFKPSTDTFTRTQTDVKYELIENHDEVINNPEKILGGNPTSLAVICEELGVSSVWPFAQSLRNHVRSYGESYYYSFRQNVSDDGIVLYFQAVYEMCNRILNDFKPEVIVSPNFVSVAHIFMKLLSDRRSIPMFGVSDTKVRDTYYFTHSHLDNESRFIDRIRDLNNGASSTSRDAALEYIESNRKDLLQPVVRTIYSSAGSFRKDLRRLASNIRHQMRNKDGLSIFGNTQDSSSQRILIRDFIRLKQYTRAARRRRDTTLDQLDQFAFFPLQFQPEEAIDVVAPYFNNQIETARIVAMSLPGDMTLAVKEHPSMIGLRRPSYLDKIARTPNVKLIDVQTPMPKILARAKLVIAPTGTLLAEAAILGVPVVQLGGLGTTKRLPNVLSHTDMPSLSDAIAEAVDMNTQSESYETRLTNFVSAAMDTGFQLDYVGFWLGDKKNLRDPIVEQFVNEVRRCVADVT